MEVVRHISEDLRQAQKERNELVVAILRVLRAEFMNSAITKMKKELEDEEATAVIRTEVKKLKEAAFEFARGGRVDLVEKNKREVEILEKYLPAQMGEEEIKKEVASIIASGTYKATDFGVVMSKVMAKLKGKADGAVVSKILKEILPK